MPEEDQLKMVVAMLETIKHLHHGKSHQMAMVAREMQPKDMPE